MRVLLIGNFELDRQESMLRFARMLTAGLQARGHAVELFSPKPRLVRWLPRYRYQGFPKLVGYCDKFVLFPRQLRAQLARTPSADVVHIIDHANAVYAPFLANRPLLATCHDLLQIRAAHGEFPQHRLSTFGRRYQHWILHHLRRIPHLVCGSLKTQQDLQRVGGVPSGRTSVIHNGLNFPYRPCPRPTARLVVSRLLEERHAPADLLAEGGRGFVLNIGGGQWYKNRCGLLSLYHNLRSLLTPAPRLVMVGKPLSPEHAAYAEQLNLGGDFYHLGRVSELQLQALYSLAEALIFPSWEEGFGWPVAEAQACGCPVFTSDRVPMTEVGGDAAEYFDPADASDAARRIAAAWSRRAELAARGLVRAVCWEPQRMIDLYLETYAQLTTGWAQTSAA